MHCFLRCVGRSYLLIVMLISGSALADQITVQAFDENESQYSLGNGTANSSFFIVEVAQFDPSLGVLQSVDYSFTDDQNLYWGLNDIDVPIGTPFPVTFTGEVQANSATEPILPVDITYSNTLNLTTHSNTQIISSPFHQDFDNILTASGTTDPSAFIGPGYTSFEFEASDSISSDQVVVGLGLYPQTDNLALDITYNYAPVPEPVYLPLLFLMVPAMVVGRGWRRRC
jgi:hypothetical protein